MEKLILFFSSYLLLKVLPEKLTQTDPYPIYFIGYLLEQLDFCETNVFRIGETIFSLYDLINAVTWKLEFILIFDTSVSVAYLYGYECVM